MADERIGIFGDMHGNLVAFEAVLAALRAEGVERFVCLGDVAAIGPQPREVVQRLRELNCPVVMGNTDGYVLKVVRGDAQGAEEGNEIIQRLREIDRWTAAQLSSDELAFMAGFAPTVTLSLADGGSLLCYHGSPRSYHEGIVPTTPPDEVDIILAGVTATVLAGGHTHQQMLRRHRAVLILNPGSVGLPVERLPFSFEGSKPPWAEYAILRVGDGGLSIELRRVVFDARAHVTAARQSGMPYAEWYAASWATD
ncbi:MAG TPA: metallophosphoesterase family protein [Ktedonobacterales bacterium]